MDGKICLVIRLSASIFLLSAVGGAPPRVVGKCLVYSHVSFDQNRDEDEIVKKEYMECITAV
jgi:hypothetical protein